MAVNGNSGIQARAKNVVNYGQKQVDRVLPPSTRQRVYDAVVAFATERPITFVFIVMQTLFSFLPLFLFISFAFSTAICALIFALVFALFWVGVAMLFLVPTLFVTFSVGILVWIWACATFLVCRWVYNRLPENMRPSSDKLVIFGNQSNGVDFDSVDVKAEVDNIKQ